MTAAEALAPKGHSRHSGFERDELDWYGEPAFVVEQLFDHEDFGGHLIWDPSCGRGTILDVAARRGLYTVGSDIVARDGVDQRHEWWPCDFCTEEPLPKLDRLHRLGVRRFAIVNNPPYGRHAEGMRRGDTYAERFVRRAQWLGAAKVAMIVNGKFLWSARRHALFMDHPPTQVLFCSDRPSMPPGHELHRLMEINRAYRNGSIDYVWLLWIDGAPPRPPAWLKSPAPAAPLPGAQA